MEYFAFPYINTPKGRAAWEDKIVSEFVLVQSGVP